MSLYISLVERRLSWNALMLLCGTLMRKSYSDSTNLNKESLIICNFISCSYLLKDKTFIMATIRVLVEDLVPPSYASYLVLYHWFLQHLHCYHNSSSSSFRIHPSSSKIDFLFFSFLNTYIHSWLTFFRWKLSYKWGQNNSAPMPKFIYRDLVLTLFSLWVLANLRKDFLLWFNLILYFINFFIFFLFKISLNSSLTHLLYDYILIFSLLVDSVS